MSKLSIVDFSNITEDVKQLVNHSYKIWFEEYSKIFGECGEALVPEIFWRAKMMTVIHDESGVQAFLLHNFYDLTLEGIPALGYFEPVNEILKKRMISEGEKVFSCEFVTVRPDLRAKFAKIRFGDLMMGCAFKTFAESSCTVAMGFSRTDVKADQMAMKFGFKKLDLVQLHGIECGVMALHKDDLIDHPYKATQDAINALWDAREDHVRTQKHQKAA